MNVCMNVSYGHELQQNYFGRKKKRIFVGKNGFFQCQPKDFIFTTTTGTLTQPTLKQKLKLRFFKIFELSHYFLLQSISY